MSMNQINARGQVFDQGPIRNYGISINIEVDGNPFAEGFLSKPESNKHSAMLTSLCEVMWVKSKEFCDKVELINMSTSKKITGDSLYHTIMTMLCDSVNEIDDRGDSLFTIKIKDNHLRKLVSPKPKAVVENIAITHAVEEDKPADIKFEEIKKAVVKKKKDMNIDELLG